MGHPWDGIPFHLIPATEAPTLAPSGLTRASTTSVGRISGVFKGEAGGFACFPWNDGGFWDFKRVFLEYLLTTMIPSKKKRKQKDPQLVTVFFWKLFFFFQYIWYSLLLFITFGDMLEMLDSLIFTIYSMDNSSWNPKRAQAILIWLNILWTSLK